MSMFVFWFVDHNWKTVWKRIDCFNFIKGSHFLKSYMIRLYKKQFKNILHDTKFITYYGAFDLYGSTETNVFTWAESWRQTFFIPPSVSFVCSSLKYLNRTVLMEPYWRQSVWNFLVLSNQERHLQIFWSLYSNSITC